MKARNIIIDAKQENIDLEFECNINNDEPKSYKDIIFEKNELEYVQNEVKNLEKKYKDEKAKQALQDLSVYLDNVLEINNIKVLITKVENKDTNILKDIVDNLLLKIEKGFILIANIKANQVNIIARSNIETLSAGDIVQQVASKLGGNGGGSKTFAQGGGKDITKLDEVLDDIRKQL